jgi:DNA-binding CsgD family transcriptional regulator
MTRAIEVAQASLVTVNDPATVAALRQVLMFAQLTQGHTATVIDLIETTLTLRLDTATRTTLTGLKAWTELLGGTAPVSLQPATPATADSPQIAILAEAIRLFLIGNGIGGVELAVYAAQNPSTVTAERNSSAEVVAPFIETYTRGPRAAAELLEQAEHAAGGEEGAATGWADPYRHFVAGSIDLACGRLDDAAAHLDTGLEMIETSDMAWTSPGVGPRSMIEVWQGNLAAAGARIDAFRDSGAPDQFGLMSTAHAGFLLLEARNELTRAAAAARECWLAATDTHRYAVLHVLAADVARIALRAADPELLTQLRTDLTQTLYPPPPATAGSTALALALSGPLTEIPAAAVAAGEIARSAGNLILEAHCWEEAACVVATFDKPAARAYARSALLITDALGAGAVSTRITARLRAVGVRLGATGGRRRPRIGWDSLTPTEQRIAELVAAGMSGPDIARQLYVSPRTVQTHVSHALAKLGLRTRAELAAYTHTR